MRATGDMTTLRRLLDSKGIIYRQVEREVLLAAWRSVPVDFRCVWGFPPVPADAAYASKMEFALLPEYAVALERRTLVADLLNRINYGLSIGSWEMDPATGDLRFRITVPSSSPITEDMMGFLFTLAEFESGRAMPAIIAVAENRSTPSGSAAALLGN